MTGRMGRSGTWGEDGVRERTAASTWRKPARWNDLALEGRLPNGAENLDGHRPRIFCASLADVFEPRPELDPWRHELFREVIAATPALDWLILTKRPEVALEWLTELYDRTEDCYGYATGVRASWEPLQNVWVGVSIENARHTYRADVLRQVPAVVRFISAEPLLGSLFPPGTSVHLDEGYIDLPGIERPPLPAPGRRAPLDLTGIDWVIVGGESGGRDSRPMHPDWAREIRDSVCARGFYIPAAVPRPALHFKQFGSYRPARSNERVDFTFPDGLAMHYAGPSPTSGGKRLDDQEWCEFPAGGLVAV